MNVTANIKFSELGDCNIAKYIIVELFPTVPSITMARLTNLSLSTIKKYRASKRCIAVNDKNGYIHVDFNHLQYLIKLYPTFNLLHYCILQMMQFHKKPMYLTYIKTKLNIRTITQLAKDIEDFNITAQIWKETYKQSKSESVIL